ncbi:MAG TPA: HAD-IB family phosphatase [Gemmatimonadales bacterium]|nr:HAD-IB family phosphatase [Gemmatimonadales bacterium]
MARFRTVVFDVDSTLTGIEGIDWLAARREPAVAGEIAALTARAMNGEASLESLYGHRLDLVKPTAAEVEALAHAYRAAAAPRARQTLAEFHAAGVAVHLISGGLREAILPFADWLGVPAERVHAVGIRFEASGRYGGWDHLSPLATAAGKGKVLALLDAAPPVLMVGDGMTDLATRTAGATFAAYTGFVRREPVVREADHVVTSFDELHTLVLP